MRFYSSVVRLLIISLTIAGCMAAPFAWSKEKKEEEKDVPPAVTVGKDGFTLKSADQKFSLKIGGYLHADSRFLLNDDSNLATNTFVLTRARLVIESKFYKSFTFRFMPDFGAGTAVVQDAYIEWDHFPGAKVRIGKYKSPIGLERLQSATALLFVARAFPTALVPNRDIGIQVSGDHSLFHYSAAIMNGVADGSSADLDTNDGKDVVARVFMNEQGEFLLSWWSWVWNCWFLRAASKNAFSVQNAKSG